MRTTSTPPLRPVAEAVRVLHPARRSSSSATWSAAGSSASRGSGGGQSKGYGFIEYNRRGVAAKVQQLLTDNLFLLGASPRPVHVEFAIDEGGADGAP